jgi:hypothetical protein
MIYRLNNGDITKKAAQAAACLKPKDFSKVYTQVQAALEKTTIPEMPLPETPRKRRKTDSSSSTPLAKRVSPRTPSTTRTAPMKISLTAPTKISLKEPENVIPSIISPSSPLKRSLPVTNTTLDLPSSSEESDVEDLPPSRRFRPVYLDCKQWNARDPRLARIWKKAEMHKEALIKQCGHPLDRYRHVDVEMDQDV